MKTQELLNQAIKKVGAQTMLSLLYKAVNNKDINVYKRYSDIQSILVKSEFTTEEAEKFIALLENADVNVNMLEKCPFPKSGDKVKKIITAGWHFHFTEENLKEDWDYCILVCGQGSFLYNRKMVENKINNIKLSLTDHRVRRVDNSFTANYSV